MSNTILQKAAFEGLNVVIKEAHRLPESVGEISMFIDFKHWLVIIETTESHPILASGFWNIRIFHRKEKVLLDEGQQYRNGPFYLIEPNEYITGVKHVVSVSSEESYDAVVLELCSCYDNVTRRLPILINHNSIPPVLTARHE